MSQSAKRKFTGPEKAMWAIAYAMTKRTSDLSPALRKAYGDGTAPPDKEALSAARELALSIYLALSEACDLAGVAKSEQQQPDG